MSAEISEAGIQSGDLRKPVYCLGAEKITQVAKIQGMSVKYCYGDEIAKWNYIFPVYETLVCLNALFTFKIIISARRRFMTILETTVHAKQLLLFKKAGK